MSDTLKKLLSVEKQAAALVAEAEAEARGLTARARAEVQKRHEEAAKAKAVELAEALDTERAALAAEREKRIAAFRAELADRKPDASALAQVLDKLVVPGGA